MCALTPQHYSNDWNTLRNLFWDGKDSDGRALKLDGNGVEWALRRALKDYTARTDKKQEDEQSASVDNMIGALETYRETLLNYFGTTAKTQQEFDQWHHEMCNGFIAAIQENKIRNRVSYGKAQKILNMTLKNLYCLEDAKDKADYFAFCHVALDSFILAWFKKAVATEWFNVDKKRAERIKISDDGPIPNWSNLQFKDGSVELGFSAYQDPNNRVVDKNKSQYHYMFFVTFIREYIENSDRYRGLTPFQAEFYIWIETQYEAAANGLLKQGLCTILEHNVGVTTNNPTIKQQNEEIRIMLDKLSRFYG